MTTLRLATLLTLFGGCSAAVGTQVGNAERDASEEYFDSPRLAALMGELNGGNKAALDEFWKAMQGNGPLIEPVNGDEKSRWITFLWRGDSNTRRMNVQGGPCSGDFADWMKRLGNTDLWYRTVQIPSDSRFAYLFQVNRPLRFPPHADKLPPLALPQADPLNPRKTSSRDRSIVELADAPPQPWLKRREGTPRGELREHTITSELIRKTNAGFQHDRQITVYTPPQYDSQSPPYGLLVLFDGQGSAFHRNPSPEMPIPVILDNLIADKTIPPYVAVFVHQTIERNRELGCSQPFCDFLSDELVPWVRKHYQVTEDAARVIVGGMSAGGRMAAYCGLRRSDVFGNVLSLSGGFEWWPGALEERLDEEPGWLTRQFVTSSRAPVRFYLAAGRFEHWLFPSSLLTENRRLRDVLLAKEYSVQYSEFSGGHDPICWANPFVEGLTSLSENTRPN